MALDPTAESKEKSVMKETLEDHADCMECVQRIEACLEEHPDREGRWVGRLLEELPKLTETMRCHFSEEQESPLYREMPERYPRFADRLMKLEGEHIEILRAAEDVMQRAGKVPPDAELYQLHELNAHVQLLVARIRRHEAEENEIVISAYWDTIGGGD